MLNDVHCIHTGHICVHMYVYACICVYICTCVHVCLYPSPFGLSSKTDFRGNHAVVVSFEYVNKSCPGA